MKRCTRCHLEKSHFYKSGKYIQSWCADCVKAYTTRMRDRPKAAAEARRAYARIRGTWEMFEKNTWNNLQHRTTNGRRQVESEKNAAYFRRGIEIRMSRGEFRQWCLANREVI